MGSSVTPDRLTLPCGCYRAAGGRWTEVCAEAARLWEVVRAAPAWSEEEYAAQEAWHAHFRARGEG